MKVVVVAVFLIIVPIVLRSQVLHPIAIDPTLSSVAAAEGLATIDELINHYEQQLLPPKLFPEDYFLSRFGGRLYRLVKLLLIEYPQDAFISLIQHEVFGHGSRLRELGVSNVQYELHPTLPYGLGNGVTDWRSSKDISRDEDNAMTIAGVQAQSLLGDQFRLRALQRGSMNYREANMYFTGRCALPLYAAFTLPDAGTYPSGNDVANYVYKVRSRNPAISVTKLKSRVILNFLDPFTLGWFYCLYNYGRANVETEIPMFRIGSLKYLPGFQFSLTPFGYEYHLENLLVDSSRVVVLTATAGPADDANSWSLRCRTTNLWKTGPFGLDLTSAFWSQPSLQINGYASSGWSLGGLLYAAASCKISDFTALRVELGYKSRGFIEGEPLDKGVILRAGLNLIE
jgi:hypothetical protein